MKKIIIGKKDEKKIYDFRETCFGIVKVGNEFYCTEKNGEISLIGGGIEKGESEQECLRREFLEEAGCYIDKVKKIYIIDCYWITRNQKNMESLANIYIVEISKEKIHPTEEGNRLIKIKKEDILKKLELPYQKRAIEEYLKNTNNNIMVK